MLCITTFDILALAAGALAKGRHSPPTGPWDLQNFTSLIAFGDSYTDDSRLGYFIAHNGSAPPTGWVDPAVSAPPAITTVLLSRSPCSSS